MSRVTVVARVVAKRDAVAAVKAELLKLIVPTRGEGGCIEYTLHQDNEDPAVFVFYETWENASCLEQHTGTDHYKAYVGAVAGMIEGKVVNKMTRIA
ncbi:MAG: antibiotic biosynthesis monooxygenase [Deltaproteobacteria bacterium]|nr:antibiotic biosynthesis monooxygenase [Deltaproteobacteria bacterium]